MTLAISPTIWRKYDLLLDMIFSQYAPGRMRVKIVKYFHTG